MPEQRQQSLGKGAKRCANMSPEPKKKAHKRFNNWKNIPLEKRKAMRKKI